MSSRISSMPIALPSSSAFNMNMSGCDDASIFLHEEHASHGSCDTEFAQFNTLAKLIAASRLPMPSGPKNM